MAARSIRLTFRYDDDRVRLAARTPRRSPPPPSEPAGAQPPPRALVLELRSAAGEVRYRRFLIDPMPSHPPRAGSFSAVVPPPDEGAQVVVSAGAQLLRTSAERP